MTALCHLLERLPEWVHGRDDAGHMILPNEVFEAAATAPLHLEHEEMRFDAADLLSDALDTLRVVYAALAGDRTMIGDDEILSAAYLTSRAMDLVQPVWNLLNETHGNHEVAARQKAEPPASALVGGKAVRS